MPRQILDVTLYSLEEAAELLGVRRDTLTKYMKQGSSVSTLIGGKKYFSEENLRNFLQTAE